MPRSRPFPAIAALTLALPALAAWAGPLDPPAGPITSTYKTLTQVEPRVPISLATTPGDADSLFKITQPGSYYLTGNVTGVAAKNGIEIAASGVTIDLSGFELAGVPGSLDGIATTVSPLTGIEIKNGSVNFWGIRGIDLLAFPSYGCVVTNIRANANNDEGIVIRSSTVLSHCTATNNGSDGITAWESCTLTSCAAFSNTADGIDVSADCVLTQCTARLNGNNGFETDSNCTITDCVSADNTSTGFQFSGGVISRCTASGNGTHGFNVGGTASVSFNCAGGNTGDGIRAAANAHMLGNVCSGNEAGIRVTSGDNRIEGNHCDANTRGFSIDIAGNLVLRNTCTANTTNWFIVAGNHYGPIIDRTDDNPPAVNGNAAAGAIGSSDSTANFTY